MRIKISALKVSYKQFLISYGYIYILINMLSYKVYFFVRKLYTQKKVSVLVVSLVCIYLYINSCTRFISLHTSFSSGAKETMKRKRR